MGNGIGVTFLQWPHMQVAMLQVFKKSLLSKSLVRLSSQVLCILMGSSEGHAGEAHTKLSKGVPIGRPPTVDLRNTHLSYVITWYAHLNRTVAQ